MVQTMQPEHPKKPRQGQPCNGCGYCCHTEPCGLAKEFLDCSKGPCVALEWKGGKSSCGLVTNPLGHLYRAGKKSQGLESLNEGDLRAYSEALGSQIAESLGVGRGCDSTDSDESRHWGNRP